MEGVQKGLGSEVSFAAPGDSYEQIVAAVESVDSFVHARSDLKMSQETKARLVTMEQETLSGASRRIQAEDLSAALADTLVERFSELTDRDIDYAARTMQQRDELLVLRMNGDHAATREGFVTAVNALREQSRQGDEAAREAFLTVLNEQLTDRMDLFEGGAPKQFAGAKDEGVTPLQALVITYSIAADDDLSGSRDEITRAAVSGYNPTRAKAFGTNGRIFSSPIRLLFNKQTMTGLLDRLEKGGR
jgi:hypothetical protein